MPASYDTLDTVVKATRVRINDAITGMGGNLLTDSQPFTIHIINAGWRKLMEFLSKLGFQKFTQQVILANLAAVSGPDPAIQARLDWAGFWNGASTQAGVALPSDFIAPISIDERMHAGTRFFEMDNFSGKGLPLVIKSPWLRAWEWRGDAIYFPGATSAIDIRLRYYSFAPDFVESSVTPFLLQTVPILRCSDSFSNYIAAEVARSRGDLDGESFVKDAEAAAMLLAARENPQILAGGR